MQKTAQKRSLLNKLRDKTNITGRLTEKYFNPEFKEIMDQLRQIDDNIRSIATGSKVGDAPAPDDPYSLKSIIKSAKLNASKREYMKAVADLGRFHKKMIDIVKLLSSFKINIDAAHEKFLFNDLDEESKAHLQSFKERWSPKTASYNYYFVKESGLLDFFTATEWGKALERNRALSSWEKRYPNKVKDLKNDTIAIIALSERMLSILLNSLENMDRARSTRNPDSYINISNKIINAFKNYDEGDRGFRKFYEKNVKDFLEKQDFFSVKPQEQIKEEAPPSDGAVTQVVPFNLMNAQNPTGASPSSVPQLSKIPNLPPVPQLRLKQPSISKIPDLPPVPQLRQPNVTNLMPEKYETIEDPVTGEITQIDRVTGEIKDDLDKTRTSQMVAKMAPAHRKFMNSLKYISGESPILLASHISKYAKSIWKSDPDTAIKLFKIVKSIKG